MRIVCWQTILMIYNTLFFLKLEKILKKLSSATVVIGALRVKVILKKMSSVNQLLPSIQIFYGRFREMF